MHFQLMPGRPHTGIVVSCDRYLRVTGRAIHVIAAIVAVFVAAGCARSPSASVPTPTAPVSLSLLPSLTCQPNRSEGWIATTLPARYVPRHSAAEAVALARTVGGPQFGSVKVALALVTDPLAVKEQLPLGPRPMWIVEHTSVDTPPPSEPVPAAGPAPPLHASYSHSTLLTYIDDAKLALGGNSSC